MKSPPKQKKYSYQDIIEYADTVRIVERERVCRILKEMALDMESLTINNFVNDVVFKLSSGDQYQNENL